MSEEYVTLLKVDEVRRLLRIHRPKVYELLRIKKLTGVKIGGDWRIHRKSVEKLTGPIDNSFFVGKEK